MDRTYRIVLDPDPEDGGYTVTVPALPGVVTQGATVEQCLDRVEEAIRLHVAAMAEDGESNEVELDKGHDDLWTPGPDDHRGAAPPRR
jgi:predicted RNase H-like HicB family nuclease